MPQHDQDHAQRWKPSTTRLKREQRGKLQDIDGTKGRRDEENATKYWVETRMGADK
jgi:hypothetical protein